MLADRYDLRLLCDHRDPSDMGKLLEDPFSFTVLCRNVHGSIWTARKHSTYLCFGISVLCNAALCGVLADHVDDGMLADNVGRFIGTGSGRGTGLLIFVAGALLSVTSVILYNLKSVKSLEKRGEYHVLQSNPQ